MHHFTSWDIEETRPESDFNIKMLVYVVNNHLLHGSEIEDLSITLVMWMVRIRCAYFDAFTSSGKSRSWFLIMLQMLSAKAIHIILSDLIKFHDEGTHQFLIETSWFEKTQIIILQYEITSHGF